MRESLRQEINHRHLTLSLGLSTRVHPDTRLEMAISHYKRHHYLRYVFNQDVLKKKQYTGGLCSSTFLLSSLLDRVRVFTIELTSDQVSLLSSMENGWSWFSEAVCSYVVLDVLAYPYFVKLTSSNPIIQPSTSHLQIPACYWCHPFVPIIIS